MAKVEVELKWDNAGLVPAVVQNSRTGEVLMVGWMNQQALEKTRTTGLVHFWSRSRQTLWRKGATSGNTLTLVDIATDCDQDTLLVKAIPAGPTCHTGQRTCFAQEPDLQGFYDLEQLWDTIIKRLESGNESSYTVHLASKGPASPSRKIIEEASELATAALNHEDGHDDSTRVSEEAADVIYHLLVLLAERGINPQQVLEELISRRRPG